MVGKDVGDSGAPLSKGPGGPSRRRRRSPAPIGGRPPSLQPSEDADFLIAEADIRQAEAAAQIRQLEESQEDLATALARYRKVYDTARTGFVSLDRQGIIREINLTAAAWLEQERERLIGMPLANYIVPDDQDAIRSHINRCDGSSGLVVTEARLDCQHRRPLPVLVESMCRGGENLYLTTIIDLTERHRAEMNLRESELRFRQLTDNIGEVFWLGAPDWSEILYVSPAFERIWGIPCKALYEKPLLWLDSVVAEDREAVLASTRSWDYQRPAPVVVSPDFRITRPDGTPRWISARAFPIVDDQGRLWHIAGVCEDITDRKQAAQALEQSEARFRTLVEDAPTAIGIGRDGVNLYVNRLYLQLFGYDRPDQAIGRPIADHWSPEWRGIVEERARQRSQELPAPSIYEAVALRRDGSQFPAQIAVTKVDLPDGPATVAFITDLTERKQAEERLAADQRQLRLLGSKLAAAEENERRRIAADLHDNVVQSLAAARLRLQTVGTGALTPEAAASFNEALHLLHQAVQDTRSLVFELCPPPLYELGLEAALEWLVEKVQNEHGLAVTLDTEATPVPLDAEVRGILFRAVRELLLNVVKHAQAGKAVVSVHRQGDGVRIEVRDDGRGFSPQGAAAGRGLGGFGLFEVRERLDYIGGSLHIESPADGGTAAVLLAPLTVAPKKD